MTPRNKIQFEESDTQVEAKVGIEVLAEIEVDCYVQFRGITFISISCRVFKFCIMAATVFCLYP